MTYTGPVFRPPFEANSLLIEVTSGCSHNACTFCTMLVRADYVGLVSGENTDKSDVFPIFRGQLPDAPLIEGAPVAMECVIQEIQETKTHLNCVVRPVSTFVRDDVLTENGKIDFEKIHPILFEMQQARYLRSGDAVGRCWNMGKSLIGE